MVKKIRMKKVEVKSKDEKGYTSIIDNLQFMRRKKQRKSIMKNKNLNKSLKLNKLKRELN